MSAVDDDVDGVGITAEKHAKFEAYQPPVQSNSILISANDGAPIEA
jgi:hypothetical protein